MGQTSMKRELFGEGPVKTTSVDLGNPNVMSFRETDATQKRLNLRMVKLARLRARI